MCCCLHQNCLFRKEGLDVSKQAGVFNSTKTLTIAMNSIEGNLDASIASVDSIEGRQ